jgi:hypothetical protein
MLGSAGCSASVTQANVPNSQFERSAESNLREWMCRQVAGLGSIRKQTASTNLETRSDTSRLPIRGCSCSRRLVSAFAICSSMAGRRSAGAASSSAATNSMFSGILSAARLMLFQSSQAVVSRQACPKIYLIATTTDLFNSHPITKTTNLQKGCQAMFRPPISASQSAPTMASFCSLMESGYWVMATVVDGVTGLPVRFEATLKISEAVDQRTW